MANFPYPNGTDSIIGLIQYDNTVTQGYFGLVVLIGFFLVAFLSLKEFETGKALAGASFLTGVLGMFLWLMDILADKLVWLPFIMLAFTVGLWLTFFKES